jgi:hypothetical protein
MPVASSQKKTTGRHLPTKAEGVHKSVSPRTGKVTWEARYRDSTGKAWSRPAPWAAPGAIPS